MDDAAIVRRLERRSDLPADFEPIAHRQRPALQSLGERLAGDILEDEVRAAAICSMPWIVAMLVCWMEASKRASRSKRATRSGSTAKCSGRDFKATARPGGHRVPSTRHHAAAADFTLDRVRADALHGIVHGNDLLASPSRVRVADRARQCAGDERRRLGIVTSANLDRIEGRRETAPAQCPRCGGSER
jgi:hypothetical protein